MATMPSFAYSSGTMEDFQARWRGARVVTIVNASIAAETITVMIASNSHGQ